MEGPRLIENHTKYYLLETLRACHNYRQNSYIFTWNLFIFIIFVVVFGFGLFLCAQRKKMLKDNLPNKIQKDQEYILNKIKEMREIETSQKQMKTMTKLPMSTPISSEYDLKRLPEHSSGYAY
jgi:F0F1-type ATP synthase membrane subunit a